MFDGLSLGKAELPANLVCAVSYIGYCSSPYRKYCGSEAMGGQASGERLVPCWLHLVPFLPLNFLLGDQFQQDHGLVLFGVDHNDRTMICSIDLLGVLALVNLHFPGMGPI